MADLNVAIAILGKDQASGPIGKIVGSLKDLGGTALSVGKPLGVLQTMLGTAGGIVLARGLDMARDAVAGLKDAMIGGNAEFERYEVQFGVLLGSAEAAKQRLAELAQFGAETPFELPEVVRADKVLQGFGLHAEDTARRFGMSGEEIRTLAGDIAAGTGVAFEEMTGYLGKFSAGATGEVISRFQELGVVTRTQMAAMGIEFSKSGELITPVDEAMTIMLGMMQDKYGGMMDAQSQTFEGMISNLEDWKAGTLRRLGAPIFEVVKDKLGNLLTFLNSPAATAALDAFANGLASGIGTAVTWIESRGVPAFQAGFGLVRDSITTFKEAWSGQWVDSDVIHPLHRFVGLLGTLASYFQFTVVEGDYLNDMLSSVPEGIQPIVRALGFLVGSVSEVVQGFRAGGLSGAVAELQQVFQQAGPELERFGAFLGGVVQQALGALVGYVQAQLPTWLATLQGWGLALVEWVSPYIPVLLAKLDELRAQAWAWILARAAELPGQFATWAQGLLAWIGPAIPPFLAQLGELATQFLTWIGVQAGPLVERFLAWKDAFLAWIPGAAVEFLQQWPQVLSGFLDWIAAGAGPILAQLGDWALSFIGWIVPMIPDLIVALGGITAGILTFIIGTAATILDKILTEWLPAFVDWILEEAWPAQQRALAEFRENLLGWIRLAADGLGEVASQIGDALVKGIGAGIDAANQWLRGKISEVADLLPGWLKERLGIASPSRVLAEQVGVPVAQGIAAGMLSQLREVRGAAEQLSSAAVPSLPTGQLDQVANDIGDYIRVIVENGDTLNEYFSRLPADLQANVQSIGEAIGQGGHDAAAAFRRYLQMIQEDGDWLNDWLTWLPADLRDNAQAVGKALADFIASGGSTTLPDNVAHLVEDGLLGDLRRGMQDVQQAVDPQVWVETNTHLLETRDTMREITTAVREATASFRELAAEMVSVPVAAPLTAPGVTTDPTAPPPPDATLAGFLPPGGSPGAAPVQVTFAPGSIVVHAPGGEPAQVQRAVEQGVGNALNKALRSQGDRL